MGILTRVLVSSIMMCIGFQDSCFGLGSIAHNYVAKEVETLLGANSPQMQGIISAHANGYLVGSDYPDTGFVPGATYGEDSHWQPFVNAYIAHLHESYPTPSDSRDQLLAFLFGICTHIQSDITSHWTYYDLVAAHDFENKPDPGTAWSTAHQLMDPGSDFYVIANKQIYNHPSEWWVPVSDLVEVYAKMNKEVSAEEIIRSNIIYYIATGLDENLIALPAYLLERYVVIPWGMSNLETEDTPELRIGAFPGQINDTVQYLNQVWLQYQTPATPLDFDAQQPKPGTSSRPSFTLAMTFAQKAVDKGWLTIEPLYNADGSITLTYDCITFTPRFEREKKRFLALPRK